MSDNYKMPFRQNMPLLLMGVESPRLVGAAMLMGGPMIFGATKLGLILAVVYWYLYGRMSKNGSGLRIPPIHALWQMGLWPNSKKCKYDPTQKDLYS